jgi:hypothetical protein
MAQGMALYPLGGDCMLRQQALKICTPMFTYPPAFAFTMVPFALASDFVWNLGWYLITLAATILPIGWPRRWRANWSRARGWSAI